MAQIAFLARDECRSAWLGVYYATEEPVYVLAPQELASWMSAPLTGTAGFFFNTTVLEPAVSPAGMQLSVAGVVIPPARARDAVWVDETFDRFEAELQDHVPGARAGEVEAAPPRFRPELPVIQKPGLSVLYRPLAGPNVEGLYCLRDLPQPGASASTAARAAPTVAEDYLRKRIAGFEGTWRY
jgi:hypothetical protein